MGKTPFPPIIIKYEGLFDFDAVYAAIADWSKNYGYIWHETGYKHKIPSVLGAEQELNWVITKNVTEYIHYAIKIHVHLFDLSELDIDVDGNKKSLSNGRMKITMRGTLGWDWQKRFAKGKLPKLFGKIYEKMWTKELDGIYGDGLWYRMWNLHAIIKKILDLQTKKYAYKNYLGEN